MKSCNIGSCLPDNPLRALHWRWMLAEYRTRNPGDEWVVEFSDAAVCVAIESASPQTAVQPSNGTGFGPDDVTIAHGIWAADGWDRCLIESRILSGQSLRDVADRLASPLSVVTAYHDLFFDVTGRLKHSSYVTHFAVRLPASPGTPVDLKTTFRAFARAGGEFVLEAFVAAHAGEIKTQVVKDRAARMEISRSLKQHIRGAVRIFRTPVTPDNTLSWLDVYVDLYAAEKLAGRAPKWRATSKRIRDRKPETTDSSLPEAAPSADEKPTPADRDTTSVDQKKGHTATQVSKTALHVERESAEYWQQFRKHTMNSVIFAIQKSG